MEEVSEKQAVRVKYPCKHGGEGVFSSGASDDVVPSQVRVTMATLLWEFPLWQSKLSNFQSMISTSSEDCLTN